MKSPERDFVNPHELLGPNGYPLGTAFAEHGIILPNSERNLNAALDILPHEGVAFTNDHQDVLGIVVAGALIAERGEIGPFVGPAALKITDGIIYRYPVGLIGELGGVELWPVPRGEEMKKAKAKEEKIIRELQRFLVSVGESPQTVFEKAKEIARFSPVYKSYRMEELEEMRDAFAKREQNLINEPGAATMIALFGSRKKYGEVNSVRWGFVELARTGIAVVPTYSHKLRLRDRDTILPFYVVAIDEPFRFPKGENEFVIAHTMTEKYKRLEAVAEAEALQLKK